ncbi:Holliday junction branch migration protein RuvA [Luteibaculum oceani]|uniref:Holliday junction branch migration complex subunit RuvA n=1 Tax=Luteibaculum oceani TaxID=1294296 RepID=A0A5C6VIU8_9FLAO|nr:Holliday junction branch migration protein RuvA [Luteibaculum oceani]TXC85057.1 Holliday junction branch migration protein RuvA [Luteibaculum oceani]
MIHFLQGTIEEKSPTHLLLDVNGVGYWIHISLNTFQDIPESGKYRIYTHLQIKEDAHSLFGFSTLEELDMFRLLIGISGVGASTARLILSSLSAQEIKVAIASEDVNTFKKIKGIGAKSAQRIILELKDKIKDVEMGGISSVSGNTLINEALSGLLVLGFDKTKAQKVLDKVAESKPESVESAIKAALKMLY